MAYDDLKRIAGVRVGALPSFNLGGSKTTAPPKTPQVIPSPASALKLALGRAGARDLRVAVLSPTRAAPVASIAASVLASSTASAAGASAAAAPAPPPAPMPPAAASLMNLAAAASSSMRSTAGDVIRAMQAAPPPPPDPPPMLAALPPAPASAIVDHHDPDPVPSPPPPPAATDAPPAAAARPLLAALPPGPIADVLRQAAAADAPARPIPAPAGASRSFLPVERARSSPAVRGAALFSGPASRGFSDVQRAQQSAAPRTTNDTTKGRSIMASRYRGTGEITYCPINSDGTINAGASSTLPGVRAQKPFQAQELLIDPTTAAHFDITDIKIGNEPVGVTAGSVSAQNFPPSNGPKFSWKVADGVDIIFSVENTSTLTVAFTAMLVGEVVESTG